MGVKYKLAVTVAQEYVKYFSNKNWKICFSKNFQPGNSAVGNVIAFAGLVAEEIQIEWEEDYFMGAASQGPEAGAPPSCATKIIPIEIGQRFLVPKDWTEPKVENSSDAPKNGFLFSAEPRATALLFQKVNDKMQVVYTTPDGPLPPHSKESLVPSNHAAVWFQRDVKSGAMVDSASVEPFVMSLESHEIAVTYDAGGEWHLVPAKKKSQ